MIVWNWLTPWEISESIIIVTILTAALFTRICKQHKLTGWQKLYFWTGLISIYIVTQTQIDYYAEHAFFVHQLQSVVLHHVGPFLLVLGFPKEILYKTFPILCKRLIIPLIKLRPIQCLLNTLVHPVVAVFGFIGLILFWLLPNIHFIMMLDWRWYRIMNWSMILSGLVFWGLVLNVDPKRSPGCRIAMMLAIVPPQILIGLLIFFTSSKLYPIYTLCGRALQEFSPLLDQQIGGLIIWTQGAMMSVIGILMVIRKQLRSKASL